MADTSSVKVDLDIATQAAMIALKNFNAQVEQADKTWDIFKGNLMANLTLDGIKGAINTVINFGKTVVNVSAEAEQSLKNLKVSLDGAGLSSERTYNELTDMAKGLQESTKYTEEQIHSVQGLLASLTYLDKDGIKLATQSIVDMAASLNIDLDAATKLVTKGINGNTEAFKKYGIQVDVGRNSTENFNNILEATAKFAGNATKQIDTFEGAEKQLTNAVGELYESLGNLITQSPILVNGMKALTSIFLSLATTIDENADDIALFGKALLAAVGIVTIAIGVNAIYTAGLVGMSAAFGTLATAATAAWVAITGPVGLAVLAVAGLAAGIYLVVKYWDDIKIATLEATATIIEYSSKAAGVFSKGASDGLKATAQSLRDQAKAAREAQKANEEKAASDKENEKAAEDADRKEAERRARAAARLAEERKKRQDDDIKFVQDLAQKNDNLTELENKRLEQMRSDADIEQQILKNKLDNQEIDYYTYLQNRNTIEDEYNTARDQALEERYEIEKARIDETYAEGLVTQNAYNQAQLTLYRQLSDAKAKNNAEQNKKDIANNQDQLRLQRQFNQQKIAATASVFGAIGDIAALGGERMFNIAKAFNLAEAITSSILAIQKAAASAPPPFNIPAIVQATAFGAVNVARIVATRPSFATGGVVGGMNGASLGGDNTTANVRTGEMILNAAQQKNLFDVANKNPLVSGNGSSEMTIVVPVQVDGVEIARVVSKQVANGFQLGEVY